MKSYFLVGTTGEAQTEAELDRQLRGQRHPWLLRTLGGSDVIAYVTLGANGDVQVDLSGRYHQRDQIVLRLLRLLRNEVGGTIEDDG